MRKIRLWEYAVFFHHVDRQTVDINSLERMDVYEELYPASSKFPYNRLFWAEQVLLDNLEYVRKHCVVVEGKLYLYTSVAGEWDRQWIQDNRFYHILRRWLINYYGRYLSAKEARALVNMGHIPVKTEDEFNAILVMDKLVKGY